MNKLTSVKYLTQRDLKMTDSLISKYSVGDKFKSHHDEFLEITETGPFILKFSNGKIITEEQLKDFLRKHTLMGQEMKNDLEIQADNSDNYFHPDTHNLNRNFTENGHMTEINSEFIFLIYHFNEDPDQKINCHILTKDQTLDSNALLECHNEIYNIGILRGYSPENMYVSQLTTSPDPEFVSQLISSYADEIHEHESKAFQLKLISKELKKFTSTQEIP